jgi:pyruvyltransferase
MTNTIKSAMIPRRNAILYHMSIGTKNWGDALNPILIKCLSGKEPILAYRIKTLNYFPLYNKNEPVYSVIGSVLKSASTKDNLIVWGSGFMKESDYLVKEPKKILAVRGHLTRDRIIDLGFDCPKVFGDPALLYPYFYKPNCQKKYILGIIPHYADRKNPFLETIRSDPNVLVIDICSGINKVIDEINSCQRIASSSLHGVIAADSYRIPSTWIELSKNVQGDGFKFYDYFSSVCRKDDEPLVVTKDTVLEDIYSRFYRYNLKNDLNQLLRACPFSNTNIQLISSRQ